MENNMAKVVCAAAATNFTALLWNDGTVTLDGQPAFDAAPIARLRAVRQIAAGEDSGVAALMQDGSIKLLGQKKYDAWQRAVDGWDPVRRVVLSGDYVIGLRPDGRLHAYSDHERAHADVLESWEGIADVAVYGTFVAGLRTDGTVVLTPYSDKLYWLDDAAQWSDLIQVTVGTQSSIAGNSVYVAGVKSDGSVVCASKYPVFEREVRSWSNVAHLAGGYRYSLLAVTRDGGILAKDVDEAAAHIVNETGVASLVTSDSHVLLLKQDGALAGYGDPSRFSLRSEKPFYTETKLEATMRAKGQKLRRFAAVALAALCVVSGALIWITDALRLYIVVSPSGNYWFDLDVFLIVVLALLGALLFCVIWPWKKRGARRG